MKETVCPRCGVDYTDTKIAQFRGGVFLRITPDVCPACRVPLVSGYEMRRRPA